MDIKSNFLNILTEAKKIQEDFSQIQDDLAKTAIIGKSGINSVKTEMRGNYFVEAIELDPAILNEDKQIIEDLIKSALNDAINKIKEYRNTKISKFKLPFDLKNVF